MTGRAVEHFKQNANRGKVEERADGSKDDHKITDVQNLPAARLVGQFVIEIAVGNGHLGQVGQQAHEMDRLGEQRQEWNEKGKAGGRDLNEDDRAPELSEKQNDPALSTMGPPQA
ncbi:hypothetical protein V5E97_33155 [Singulisphaera sp. Ch08]|uniref:Uncharacterized protein n=1 Tax=Singulisphaera sp. Ch08 TaxID=3120278 RepID=A0AAU7CCZ4_9BACT